MQNPARLRAIYAELRRATGNEVAAADLLRLAHMLLKRYRLDIDDELDDYGRPVDSRAFFALPVDEAMEDGGWRVLNFETRRRFGIDELDPREITIIKRAVRRYLGPEWPQQIRED
jgi:hypothetical protein